MMQVKMEGLNSLLFEVANGNYNKLSKILKIDVGYLHKVINGKANGGLGFTSKIYDYCKINDLPIHKYIFL